MITKHPFEYHKPSEGQQARMKQLNEGIKGVYDQLEALVPASAERTLAVRKLQEARMWANAAIVLNEES